MSAPEKLLARILERVPQPVWVVDHPGFIVFANPAACSALGYRDPGELRGRPSHATVHYKRPDGTPFPEAECPMLGPRETGETVHSDDDWLVRRDGSMFPIAWWSAPIDMPGGRGAVLAFTDVTERLASEKAIRERDAAEIRAAESQAAQRRILESATAARHQLACDLHDGAQQRLVTLLLDLKMARDSDSSSRRGPAAAEQCHRAGRRRFGGFARAGGGHSPGDTDQPRPRPGCQGLGPAFGASGDCLGSHTRPTARCCRGQRLLPDRRSADQRGQTLQRESRHGVDDLRRRHAARGDRGRRDWRCRSGIGRYRLEGHVRSCHRPRWPTHTRIVRPGGHMRTSGVSPPRLASFRRNLMLYGSNTSSGLPPCAGASAK